MKKLLCIFLLGTTFALQANTPDCNCKPNRPRNHRFIPRPGRPPHARPGHRQGFVEVTLQDLQITETGILATINETQVPVRFIRVKKDGKVFVKPIKERQIVAE